jgi:hypothetical protein
MLAPNHSLASGAAARAVATFPAEIDSAAAME